MAHTHVPPPAQAAASLLAAYLAARYEVRGPRKRLRLRIGRPAPQALAALLPAGDWTLLTAWNPGSRVVPEADNLDADATLQADLDALGLRRLPAAGNDGAGQWHEPGWLVADLGSTRADALARRYGQAGVLHWKAGDPVRLRMYLAPTPEISTSPWVDWAVPAAGAVQPG